MAVKPGKLLAVVCANGLGHYRRTIGVLDRLIATHPVHLTIACEAWQVERTSTWPALVRVQKHAELVHGITHPGIKWSARSGAYDEALWTWVERLRPHARVADLVVSDNLVGALEVRPDAVLMGSFLWADVLEAAHPENPFVREFVARDRALLASIRPPMLCVADIAMPGVTTSTAAVPLAWMCETIAPLRPDPRVSPRIGVFGGATGSSGSVLEAAAALLEKRFTVERGGESEAEYDRYDVVVCRPGVGTITGCIAARVPMVLAYEAANSELSHNAARLAALGVAIDCGTPAHPLAIEQAVDRWLDPEVRRAGIARFAALPVHGLDGAARWLIERLESKPS